MATANELAIQALRDKLKSFPNIIRQEIHQEILASVLTIVRNAQVAAPVNFGVLRSNISFIENGELDVEVTASVNYSAYMEFGTGNLVNVPAGYELIANEFRGNGIRQVNIRPRPYLIPAINAERPLLVARINEIIAEETSKL